MGCEIVKVDSWRADAPLTATSWRGDKQMEVVAHRGDTSMIVDSGIVCAIPTYDDRFLFARDVHGTLLRDSYGRALFVLKE